MRNTPSTNRPPIGSRNVAAWAACAADTLKLATDTPQRVAGKLTIDDSKAGGAKASVEFDATLLKEFTKGR